MENSSLWSFTSGRDEVYHVEIPARVKELERHCQIRRILISSRTMSIHLAGWAINRDGARAVKKLRFLNISLVCISLKKRWDPVHTS